MRTRSDLAWRGARRSRRALPPVARARLAQCCIPPRRSAAQRPLGPRAMVDRGLQQAPRALLPRGPPLSRVARLDQPAVGAAGVAAPLAQGRPQRPAPGVGPAQKGVAAARRAVARKRRGTVDLDRDRGRLRAGRRTAAAAGIRTAAGENRLSCLLMRGVHQPCQGETTRDHFACTPVGSIVIGRLSYISNGYVCCT